MHVHGYLPRAAFVYAPWGLRDGDRRGRGRSTAKGSGAILLVVYAQIYMIKIQKIRIRIGSTDRAAAAAPSCPLSACSIELWALFNFVDRTESTLTVS